MEVIERFIYFGANGVSFFQGCHIGMAFQLKEKRYPYMMGSHYMAHITNLFNSSFVKPTNGVQVGGFALVLGCLLFELP